MPSKAQVIALIQLGHNECCRYAVSLTEAERAAPSAPDQWNAKDNLAHLAAWKNHQAEQIAITRQGGTPELTGDFQAVNDYVYQLYCERSWDEVMASLDAAQAAMLAQMEVLSEDDLNEVGRFPWLQDRPLWRAIAGNSFQHPMAHLGELYIRRGNQDYATELRETEAKLMLELDDLPANQAVAIYNLGCHYALMGEKQKALEKIAAALRLSPGLREWSMQDTDLVSLHADPDFLALINQG